MKRTAHWLPGCALSLAVLLSGCGNGRNNGGTQPEPPSAQPGSRAENQPEGALRIRVETDTHSIVFLLNGSPAAISLYAQLPLTLPVENFGINEKIVYPPEELEVDGTPPAEGPAGTLAYYAPWGNVAMFYGTCGGAGGLYALGEAVTGADQIGHLTGTIRMEAVTDEGTPSPSAPSAESSAGPSPEPQPAAGEVATTLGVTEDDKGTRCLEIRGEDSLFSGVLSGNGAGLCRTPPLDTAYAGARRR